MFHNYNNYTDEELIHFFLLNADPEALGCLYTRYSNLTLGLMMKYVGDYDMASDLTMDLFEKLPDLLRKHHVKIFRPWWYITSKNYVLMHLRKEKKLKEKEKKLWEEEFFFVENQTLSHHGEYEATLDKLSRSLAMLHPDQRTCIELFYLRNKSYREIEQITGWNFNEIKSHIQNGKRNLRILMKKKHG